jgi:N-methylhydantoinase B
VLRGKGRDEVPAGGVLVMETPGGGGIGDVAGRDPAQVHADLEAGLISEQAARDQYGVEPP